MAVNPSSHPDNTLRITGPTTEYPYGSGKHDSTGLTGDGTPFKKSFIDDIYGQQQWLLTKAEIVPSGNTDNVINCQQGQALQSIIAKNLYDPLVNYSVHSRVIDSNGLAKICVATNGPGSTVRDPSSDNGDYWALDDMATTAVAGDFRIDSGTANNYILNPPGDIRGISTLRNGARFRFKVLNVSAGATVISVDEVPGNKTLVNNQGSAITDELNITDFHEIVFDDANDRFVLISQLAGGGGNPVGRINLYLGTNVPDGEIAILTRQTLSRTVYSELWAYALASGNLVATPTNDGQWGEGDGSTTFDTPAVGGWHMRMLDGGNGVNTGRAIGTEEQDQLLSHDHNFTASITNSTWRGQDGSIANVTKGNVVSTGSTSLTGGPENRVKTLAFNATITYEA